MKKIYILVIALGMLFLCCKQRTGLSGMGGGAAQGRGVVQGGVVQTEQQRIYSKLRKKVAAMVNLYSNRESGVIFFNAEFEKHFKVKSEFEEDYVYAALGGDKGAMANLKKILIDINETHAIYGSDGQFYSHNLHEMFRDIGKNCFEPFIKFFYTKDNFLARLESVQDVQLLSDIVVDLKTLHEKWVDLITKLQYEVKEIAGFYDKYLEFKRTGKEAEMKVYRDKVKDGSSGLILVIRCGINKSSRGGLILCDAIKNFLAAQSEVERKVRAIAN
ncbi:hypothetical protein [Borrelia persica]|uniref:hypothetical protein n=1 Tax=Borrelia persica TaxID=44448 RepID=UPI000464170E|nr:hypothetical protein [Borrelia persica]